MKTFKTLVSVFALSALFATSSCTQQQNQKEMDNHSNVFMYENDMEWEPAGEGVTRQIVGYNERRIRIYHRRRKESGKGRRRALHGA